MREGSDAFPSPFRVGRGSEPRFLELLQGFGLMRSQVKPHVGDVFSENLIQETSSNCLI
jgi:hypothetical protein